MNRRKLLKTSASGLAGLFSAAWLAKTHAATPVPSGTAISDPCFCSEEALIRLCCNENPYGPAPSARKAIADSLHKGNHYPRTFHRKLVSQIAEYHQLSEDQVLVCSGSANVLQLIGLYMGQQKKDILSADNTFQWMMSYAAQFGCQWQKVPLDEKGYFDLEGLQNALSDQIGLVYLCNPNNPTGTYLPAEKVHTFCRSVSQNYPILVDEAYIEYTENGDADSAARLISEHPNVMVCRTFSKLYGMAGLRVGYLLAAPEMIKKLAKLEPGYGMNVSNTSLAAASASLADESFRSSSRAKNAAVRQLTRQKLQEWNVPIFDASANFIFCDVSHIDTDLKEAFAQENFQLWPFKISDKTYLRLTIGSQEQMALFSQKMAPYFLNP
ncbi:MAG: histidinol-phosphate transaminase [Bacteroidota bacterium]